MMPKRPYEWRVDTYGGYKFNNAELALGPRDTTACAPPFSRPSITRSEQAQQRRMKRNASKRESQQSHRRLTQPSAT